LWSCVENCMCKLGCIRASIAIMYCRNYIYFFYSIEHVEGNSENQKTKLNYKVFKNSMREYLEIFCVTGKCSKKAKFYVIGLLNVCYRVNQNRIFWAMPATNHVWNCYRDWIKKQILLQDSYVRANNPIPSIDILQPLNYNYTYSNMNNVCTYASYVLAWYVCRFKLYVIPKSFTKYIPKVPGIIQFIVLLALAEKPSYIMSEC